MADEMNRLPDFLTRAQLNAGFLDSLSTYVGNRPTKYENIVSSWTKRWQIWEKWR